MLSRSSVEVLNDTTSCFTSQSNKVGRRVSSGARPIALLSKEDAVTAMIERLREGVGNEYDRVLSCQHPVGPDGC